MYRKDTGQSYRYRKRKWVQRAVENAQAYADESSSSFTTDDDKHPRQSVVFTKAKKQETNLDQEPALLDDGSPDSSLDDDTLESETDSNKFSLSGSPPSSVYSLPSTSGDDLHSSTDSTVDHTEEDVFDLEDGETSLQHPYNMSAATSTQQASGSVPTLSFQDKLAEIALQYNIPGVALSAIANLIKKDLNVDINVDARTILGTPRTTPNCSDDFVHIGLKESLTRKIGYGLCDPLSTTVILQTNIDGIPLYNSSRTGFWPILGLLKNGRDREPFAISIWCGIGKPPNLERFLDPFLNELLDVLENGITVASVHYDVHFDSCCCDAPARALLKCIKGHNGYGGCERCIQHGRRLKKRTVFPVISSKLRTNASFRARMHKNHHLRPSPFLKLRDLDMIYGFPLDYMHLVCLGVVKTFIKILVKDLNHKLSDEQHDEVSRRILLFKKYLPCEFNRKGRPICDVSFWKANEFRLFLLYTGPLVLKGVLDNDKYQNFLNLHVAIRLLLQPKYSESQVLFAEKCLEHFVQHFGVLYGEHRLVYNFHSLIHLAKECLTRKSSLESFSCFPFENYLGHLKRLIRGTRKELQQVVRRLHERSSNTTLNLKRVQKACEAVQNLGSINPRNINDSVCLLTPTNTIVRVAQITADEVVGYEYNILKSPENPTLYENTFELPVKSSHLKYFIADGVNDGVFKKWPKAECSQCVKCVVLPYKHENRDAFFIMPLLHHM